MDRLSWETTIPLSFLPPLSIEGYLLKELALPGTNCFLEDLEQAFCLKGLFAQGSQQKISKFRGRSLGRSASVLSKSRAKPGNGTENQYILPNRRRNKKAGKHEAVPHTPY